jgi:broad specificity phosphatase PhoE
MVVSSPPQAVFHSGLSRTRFLADEIACRAGREVRVIQDTRLRERDYGDWQGQSWQDAYHSDPKHFHDLIQKPETYRPPGGESTAEMQSRAAGWLRQTAEQPPTSRSGPIIAITHSGPIAAIAGHLLNLHATEWEPWTIGTLEAIRIRRDSNTNWSVEKISVQSQAFARMT